MAGTLTVIGRRVDQKRRIDHQTAARVAVLSRASADDPIC